MADETSVECTHDLISTRQAAGLLTAVGLNRTRAQLVLDSGLAGEPVRTSSAHLYHARRVRALVDRPVVGWRAVDALDLHALFVARTGVDPGLGASNQVSSWCRDPSISIWTRVAMMGQIQSVGPVPVVATVCGFVALGAELIGYDRDWTVRAPGPWFETMRDGRLLTGPGPRCLYFQSRRRPPAAVAVPRGRIAESHSASERAPERQEIA